MAIATKAPAPRGGVQAFNDNTRQYLLRISDLNYGSGPMTVNFNRVGFLARIYVTVDLTVNVTLGTGSGAYAAHAPYTFIRRFKVVANNGFEIWSSTGYGLYLHYMVTRFGNTVNAALLQAPATVTTSDFYNLPAIANGNNLIRFSLMVNVALNERDPLGLVLLQNEETTVNIEIQWDQATAGGATCDSITLTAPAVFGATPITGKAELHIEYFSVPQDPKNWPPIGVLHQVLEDNVPLAGTGDNIYTVPRGNTYVRIICYMCINGLQADSDAMDSWRLRINQSDVPYLQTDRNMRFLQRHRYGIDLPKGVRVYDFYHSMGLVNMGSNRDFIHSQDLSLLEVIPTITTGTTFGTNTNFQNNVRDQLVQVA